MSDNLPNDMIRLWACTGSNYCRCGERCRMGFVDHIPYTPARERDCENAEPERVICAAIWVDDGLAHPRQSVSTGIVIGGWRHHAILDAANLLAPVRLSATQGFLTSAGRFVTRTEALKIAFDASQIDATRFSLGSDELFSEDLY